MDQFIRLGIAENKNESSFVNNYVLKKNGWTIYPNNFISGLNIPLSRIKELIKNYKYKKHLLRDASFTNYPLLNNFN